mgnify:CR=1 FL=1
MDFVLYSIAYNRVHKKVKHNITLRCTHAVNAMHAGGHIVGNYQNNERQVNLDGRFFGLEPSPLLYMFCYCICVIYISLIYERWIRCLIVKGSHAIAMKHNEGMFKGTDTTSKYTHVFMF